MKDGAAFPTYVTNTHQDYAHAEHPASVNIRMVFETLSDFGIGLTGRTIAEMCDLVRCDNPPKPF